MQNVPSLMKFMLLVNAENWSNNESEAPEKNFHPNFPKSRQQQSFHAEPFFNHAVWVYVWQHE